MRVLHIINNLQVGGAESMLLKLLKATDRKKFEHDVVALIGRGELGPKIETLGISVDALGFRRAAPKPTDLLRLRQRISRHLPDVVQTWMFHADLLGGAAVRSLEWSLPVIWNIRHSDLKIESSRRSTLWTAKACALLSRIIPQRIIVNSQAGLEHYANLGYARERMIRIPNGFELDRFVPDHEANAMIRQELGIACDQKIVGHMGRLHPDKDHGTLFRAAEQIAAKLSKSVFVFCGEGVTAESDEMREYLKKSNYPERFFLLGRRNDAHKLQASFDVALSSSRSEGFPNVIGEAMACGVPCVVTDVGGSAEVVGDTGRVVPPDDPSALAAACVEILQLDRGEYCRMGELARQRVIMNFDIKQIARTYERVWQEAATIRSWNTRKRAA